MPVTISGDGGIAGISSLGGGDFVAGSLTSSGDLIAGPQAVDRATLFVDDSDNSVSINTTVTPAAGVFLQVADATDPIVSLNNTANGEVRLGCNNTYGYIGTETNDSFSIRVNGARVLNVLTNNQVNAGNQGSFNVLDGFGERSGTLINGSSSQNSVVLGADPDNTAASSQIIFQVDNNSKVRINNDGQVLVGNTGLNSFTPQSTCLLQVGPSGNALPSTAFPDGIPPTALFYGQRNVSQVTDVNRVVIGQDGSLSSILAIDAVTTNTADPQVIIRTRDASSPYHCLERVIFQPDGAIALANTPGIDFSGISSTVIGSTTVTSNTLDDYEEGTFDSGFATGNSSSPTGVTYTNQRGFYTKVGRFVSCVATFTFTDYTSFPLGYANFTLPFAPNAALDPGADAYSMSWWAIVDGGQQIQSINGADCLAFGPLGASGFSNIFITGTQGLGNANFSTIFNGFQGTKTIRYYHIYVTDD